MANNLINGDSFDFVEGTEKTAFKPVQLWSGSAGVGDTIMLSESFEHFRSVLFITTGLGQSTVLVGEEGKGSTATSTFCISSRFLLITQLGSAIVNQGVISEMAARFNVFAINVSTTTSMSIIYTKEFSLREDGAVIVSPSPDNLAKVYGIGRISS